MRIVDIVAKALVGLGNHSRKVLVVALRRVLTPAHHMVMSHVRGRIVSQGILHMLLVHVPVVAVRMGFQSRRLVIGMALEVLVDRILAAGAHTHSLP